MGKTILIADDAKSAVKLQEVLLNRTKAQILTAYDGYEALKKIQENKPDLVLLDYEMPGMTGEAICKFVKSRKDLSHIKVIIVTAHGSQDVEEKCRRAGCDEFLKKPINFRELLRVVSSFI